MISGILLWYLFYIADPEDEEDNTGDYFGAVFSIVRFPVVTGMAVVGLGSYALLTRDFSMWQQAAVMGGVVAVWCSVLVAVIRGWKDSLTIRQKTKDEIMEESSADESFLENYGIDEYMPATNSLIDREKYAAFESFVFSFGFGGAVLWTGFWIVVSWAIEYAEGSTPLYDESVIQLGFLFIALISTAIAVTVPVDRILTDGSLFGYGTINIETNTHSEEPSSVEYNEVTDGVWYSPHGISGITRAASAKDEPSEKITSSSKETSTEVDTKDVSGVFTDGEDSDGEDTGSTIKSETEKESISSKIDDLIDEE